MQKQLAETLDFMRQVERNYHFDGGVPLSRLPRVLDVLPNQDADVKVSLEFGTSVGYACLKGHMTASLQLECQRCLQPMPIDFISDFKLAFVRTEDECDELPEDFEPFLLEGEEQSMMALLEDEILLSLPMVSLHQDDCSEFMRQHEDDVKAQKEAAHPFAALRDLKNKDS